MKKIHVLLTALFFISSFLHAQDILNNEVKIGNQGWMDKNLNVEKFRNGDLIANATSSEEWKKAGDDQQPAWCYFNNDPTNGLKFGKLYNWYAVNDPRGLAPQGWHIPSEAEWIKLTDFFIEKNKEANKKKKIENARMDQDELKVIESGSRKYNAGFYNVSNDSYWWSATEKTKTDAFTRGIPFTTYAFSYYTFKAYGFPVRCLKD